MQVKEKREGEPRVKKPFPWQMVLFTALLTVVGLASLTLEKPTVSEIEKRELAKAPTLSVQSWFNGSFAKEADAFFADTFPARDLLVLFSNSVKENLGLRFDDVRIVATDDPVDEMPSSSAAEQPPEKPPAKPPEKAPSSSAADLPQPEPDGTLPDEKPQPNQQIPDEGDIGISKSGVFIYKGMGMSLFGGNKSVGETYAANINAYREALGDSVRIFDMVVPTSAEFYLPARYQKLSNSQWDAIHHIYDNLADGVIGVDAYSAISQHTDQYLYFNSDHHWTGRGAYWAYTAFAKAAGFAPLNIDTDYTVRQIDGFLGSLYGMTQDSQIREKGDFVEYFIPATGATATIRYQNSPYHDSPWVVWEERVKGGNGYLVFLCGDAPLITINTETKNGKSIAVVKESFGNAFVPFLIPHYETIYVVDERYFQTSLLELLQENEVDDLLFMNNAFSAMTAYHANNLAKIMDQPYVPVPVQTPEEEPEDEEDDDGWVGILDEDAE